MSLRSIAIWISIGFLLGVVCLIFTDALQPDSRYPTDEELNWCTMIPIENTTAKNDSKWELRMKMRLFVAGFTREFRFVVNERRYGVFAGIPTEEMKRFSKPVIVYQAGYCKSGTSTPSSVCRALLKTNVCPNYIIITVECPFDAWKHYRRFNFAQRQDQWALARTVQRVKEINSNANVVLFGASKGALNAARMVSNQMLKTNDISGLILECPPMSMEQSMQHFFGGPFVSWLAPRVMPSYNRAYPVLYDIGDFPRDLPVLISNISTDDVAVAKDVDRFVSRLLDIGVPKEKMQRYTHTEGKLIHGHLGKDKHYQKIVVEFLEKCSGVE